jgi:hypothetical protein
MSQRNVPIRAAKSHSSIIKDRVASPKMLSDRMAAKRILMSLMNRANKAAKVCYEQEH